MDNQQKKEYVLGKIKQIVTDEKFKLDAFYLCGVASGLPNEGLQKACEGYLKMVDSGNRDEKIVSALLTELEKAKAKKDKVKVVGNLVDNRADIQEVYAHREFL